MKEYPDNSVTEAILGISQFGARISFEDVRTSITIHPNLSSAFESPDVVTAEIEAELKRNRLRKYCSYNTLPGYFIALPLGLTDNLDGTKRRIHHHSYPSNDANSINSGISKLYGSISYSTIMEAISAIQHLGNSCSLVKGDFQSAFRHTPVSPLDMAYSVFTSRTRTKQNNTYLSGFAQYPAYSKYVKKRFTGF